MSIRRPPDSPPVFDVHKPRARWDAAREAYLAGAGAPEVCARHGLDLSTFRRRAMREGWRRTDPPAPAPPPDASPPKHGDAAPLLTAAQMADKAWSMLQAAMAAGRLIEARGWLRLHRDLQPYVREEADARRRARMDREAAAVGLTLDCFSPEESNTPNPAHAPLVIPETPPGVIRDGTGPHPPEPGPDGAERRSGASVQAAGRPAQPDGCPGGESMEGAAPVPALRCASAGMTRRTSGEGIGLALDCFSAEESNTPGPAP